MLTVGLGDGQRSPVERPCKVRKRSVRGDAFKRDGLSWIEDLPGERVRQVRREGSDGSLIWTDAWAASSPSSSLDATH